MVANCGPAPGANPSGVGRHCPKPFPPRYGGGAGVNPSVARQARIPFATVVPQAMPAAMPALVSCGSAAMAVRDTASRASKVAFWGRKSATNAVYAACTAAARREAPAGAAAATCTGAYFLSIPLTASKTEAWTMAATRVVTSGEVPDTVTARSMCWFQSVMSSARSVDATQKKITTLIARTADFLGQNMVVFPFSTTQSLYGLYMDRKTLRREMIGFHPSREIGRSPEAQTFQQWRILRSITARGNFP